MKLFKEKDNIIPQFSLEQYRDYCRTASVISQESITDYFYKVKDLFSTTFQSLSGVTNDKIVIDSVATRFETLHRLKRVKFIDVKDNITSKPENFRGKYVDYTLDLINSSRVIVESAEVTLNNLKLAISSFLNEYSENKVSTLYGATYFKDSEKVTEANRKDIAKYFTDTNSSSKTYVKDVLKTLNDVESLYKNIEVLDTNLNFTKIQYIAKLTQECVDLMDSIIDQNTKNDIFSRNDSVKKELIYAVHVSARSVEFLNYLYSNAIIFYSVFKNLTQDLSKAVDLVENN